MDSGVARKLSSGGPTELIYNAVARQEIGAEWPVLLPGAKAIVFRTRRANQPPGDFQIVGMKLPGGEPKVLIRGVYARYSPTGHLLVATADGKLIAVPFDADELKVTGSPVGLLEGLGVEGSGFSVNLALSRRREVVAVLDGAGSEIQSAENDVETVGQDVRLNFTHRCALVTSEMRRIIQPSSQPHTDISPRG